MRKLSTAEFILKAKEKHGNTYDYSLVAYNKAEEIYRNFLIVLRYILSKPMTSKNAFIR
jgi:hypothetical protein